MLTTVKKLLVTKQCVSCSFVYGRVLDSFRNSEIFEKEVFSNRSNFTSRYYKGIGSQQENSKSGNSSGVFLEPEFNTKMLSMRECIHLLLYYKLAVSFIFYEIQRRK